MDGSTEIELDRRDVLQKSVATGTLVAGGTALVGTATARGRSNCTLNWGEQLNGGKCEGLASPVINVERNVINGLDSGEAGNWWARDTFRQKIQVWETSADSFCGVLTYRGTFDAFAGERSPGDGGTLTGDEGGPFEGGLRMTFDGTFDPGDAQTRGSLGTVDQNCDRGGNCDFSSTTGWIDDYFDDVGSIALEWWGWIYHGGDCGTWVNAIDGNCGDVLCE